MSYSQLQKDFKEKDIQRLRNLVTEKYGEKTITQVGHEKDHTVRHEGEIWEESGKTWTIKNGLKQTHTKLDEIKKAIRMPLCCPTCKSPMKHVLDGKFYSIHKECHGCVVKKETFMRLNGTYKEYAEKLVKSNVVSFIEEAKEFIQGYGSETTEEFFTEQGEKENFVGTDNKKKRIETWTKELEDIKTQLLDNKSDNLNPPTI